ncbi:MAG: Clp1/GlmU family protein [Actinomycetota bacterium]
MEEYTDFEKLIYVLSKEKGINFLLGHIDTGKTTFSKEMIKAFLNKGEKVGFVDSDVGQSTAGPPTTIGAKLVKNKEDIYNLGKDFESLYFVGSTSPRRNFLPMVIGTYSLSREVKGKAESLVIDTTGLVLGSYGQVLKYNKINFIKPRHLVLFEKEEELKYYKEMFYRQNFTKLYILKVKGLAKEKSNKEREKRRKEKFSQYLNEASEDLIDLESVGTFPPKEFFLNKVKEFNVVGLEDINNRCLGIGIFLNADKNSLKIYTPVESRKVKFLKLGGIRINKEAKSHE